MLSPVHALTCVSSIGPLNRCCLRGYEYAKTVLSPGRSRSRADVPYLIPTRTGLNPTPASIGQRRESHNHGLHDAYHECQDCQIQLSPCALARFRPGPFSLGSRDPGSRAPARVVSIYHHPITRTFHMFLFPTRAYEKLLGTCTYTAACLSVLLCSVGLYAWLCTVVDDLHTPHVPVVRSRRASSICRLGSMRLAGVTAGSQPFVFE